MMGDIPILGGSPDADESGVVHLDKHVAMKEAEEKIVERWENSPCPALKNGAKCVWKKSTGECLYCGRRKGRE